MFVPPDRKVKSMLSVCVYSYTVCSVLGSHLWEYSHLRSVGPVLITGAAPPSFTAQPNAWGNANPFCQEKDRVDHRPKSSFFCGFQGERALCLEGGGERGEDSCRIETWQEALTFPASLGGDM